MKVGYVREQDPLALGHWIARITFTCLLAPPPGDLLAALDAILLPVLDPAVHLPEPVGTTRATTSTTSTTSSKASRATAASNATKRSKERHRA